MDWNNDGRKDLVVGESANSGRVRIYLNAGTDAAPVFNTYTNLTVGGADFTCVSQSQPEIVDWNNDGRKDVLCGSVYGEVHLLLNTGSDAAPAFAADTLIQDGGVNLVAGWRSSPVVVDWNLDGKKDLLVGCEMGTVYYFENRGTDASPVFDGSSMLTAGDAPIEVGYYSRLDVTDWDGDGMKDLLVGDADGRVLYFHAVNPMLPCVELTDWLMNDSAGNTNGMLDAGETAQITVCLTNRYAHAENVWAVLSSTSAAVAVVSSYASLGVLDHGATIRNSRQPFAVAVATNAPQGVFYPFDLAVGWDGCSVTSHFAFAVGCYAADAEAPFAWVDASGGKPLAIRDETVTAVPLPFEFPFFGSTWTSVGICDNGYLQFGAPVPANINAPLPSPEPPNGMVAPFWCDLDPSTGGVVRGVFGGTTPNRYVCIEWNGVPGRRTDGRYTFEVLLFENGRMKFQYGTMSGTGADGSLAAIGIEDLDGRRGVQYSWHGAGSVYAGLAIEINPSSQITDADADGLPDTWERFYFGGGDVTADGDADGDGLLNWQELRAGTDPADASSVLRLNGIRTAAANQCVLDWQSVAGGAYVVQSRTNLLTGAWTNLNGAGMTAGAGGSCTWTTPVSQARQILYRISVP